VFNIDTQRSSLNRNLTTFQQIHAVHRIYNRSQDLSYDNLKFGHYRKTVTSLS